MFVGVRPLGESTIQINTDCIVTLEDGCIVRTVDGNVHTLTNASYERLWRMLPRMTAQEMQAVETHENSVCM